jgi:hypothetical protein
MNCFQLIIGCHISACCLFPKLEKRLRDAQRTEHCYTKFINGLGDYDPSLLRLSQGE